MAVNPVTGAIDWVLTAVGLSASDSNDHLIKRVIGLPGDTVMCCNAVGQMEVNGVPLDEPYLKLPDGVDKVSFTDFSRDRAGGRALGDGRQPLQLAGLPLQTGTPSKGFVPIDNIVGRAFVVTWPTEHWGWLDDYPSTFRGVDRDE